MVKVDGNGGDSSLIQVRDLDKTYRRGGEEIHVLQGLNLDVSRGESRDDGLGRRDAAGAAIRLDPWRDPDDFIERPRARHHRHPVRSQP